MSDIDLAIRRAKRLEAMLRRNYGVNGRGLHELIDAAKSRNALPNALARKLRFIATIRNRIVHDIAYTKIDDREGFISACDEAERELTELAGTPDSWRTTVIVAIALFLTLVGGLIIALWLLRSRGLPLW